MMQFLPMVGETVDRVDSTKDAREDLYRGWVESTLLHQETTVAENTTSLDQSLIQNHLSMVIQDH